MADKLVEIAPGFWNIRGSFKVAKIVDIGTQSSLVRLGSGRFVLLDAYTLSGEVEQRVRALTDGGAAIDAILNVHPFHTIHVRKVHEQLPHAKLYGTSRHRKVKPDLPWEELDTEDPALHDRFAADLDFSVPRGVDFVPDDERLHFSSVLVRHRASRVLHVDDTLTYLQLPFVGGLSFHFTLKSVLGKRPGAVAEFRAWCDELLALCEGVDHLCTAHGRALPRVPEGGTVAGLVRGAVERAQKTLTAHEKRFG
jgi:hypothetical protein